MAEETYRYRKGKERLRGGKIIRLHDINPWEFRGHFEGEKGITFVFQYKDVKKASPKEKCRCYINLKYYAHQAKIGGAGMKNYKPCPVHEKECYPKSEVNHA